MSRYRKIAVRTWSDEKFRSISKMPPSAQGLWFFLIAGPMTGPIPGLFRAGKSGMAEELDWPQEAFDEAFGEVLAKGMAKADFDARLVWLPKALEHNRPESPNVVRSWRTDLDLLPECGLKKEAIEAMRAFVGTLGTGFAAAFDEICPAEQGPPKPSPKPSGKPKRKASPKTMPNQEQEQEQEQEEEQSLSDDNDRSAGADLLGDRSEEKPGTSSCPQREIIAAYHELLPELPPVHEWTAQNADNLRTRWRSQDKRQTVDWWRRFFAYIRTCPFLMGEKTDFQASLGWLVKAGNFAKVVNGQYDSRKVA